MQLDADDHQQQDDDFDSSSAGEAFLTSTCPKQIARSRGCVRVSDHNQRLSRRMKCQQDHPGYVRPVQQDPNDPKSGERYIIKDAKFYRKNGPAWTDIHHTPPSRKHLVNYRPDLDAWHEGQVQQRVEAELIEQAKHVRYEYQRYHQLRRRQAKVIENRTRHRSTSQATPMRRKRNSSATNIYNHYFETDSNSDLDVGVDDDWSSDNELKLKKCEGRGRHTHRENRGKVIPKNWLYLQTNENFADKVSEIPNNRVRFLISPQHIENDRHAVEHIARKRREEINTELEERLRRQERAKAIRIFFHRQSRTKADWIRSIGIPRPRCFSASSCRPQTSEPVTLSYDPDREEPDIYMERRATRAKSGRAKCEQKVTTKKSMRPSSAPSNRFSELSHRERTGSNSNINEKKNANSTKINNNSNNNKRKPRTFSPQRMQELAEPRMRTQVQETDPLQTTEGVGLLLHPRALRRETIEYIAPQSFEGQAPVTSNFISSVRGPVEYRESSRNRHGKCGTDRKKTHCRPRTHSEKNGAVALGRNQDKVEHNSGHQHTLRSPELNSSPKVDRINKRSERRRSSEVNNTQRKNKSNARRTRNRSIGFNNNQEEKEQDKEQYTQQHIYQHARNNHRRRPQSSKPTRSTEKMIESPRMETRRIGQTQRVRPSSHRQSSRIQRQYTRLASAQHRVDDWRTDKCARQPQTGLHKSNNGWMSDFSGEEAEQGKYFGTNQESETKFGNRDADFTEDEEEEFESKHSDPERVETLNELDDFESRLLQLEYEKAEADKRRPAPPAFYMRCVREGHCDEVTI